MCICTYALWTYRIRSPCYQPLFLYFAVWRSFNVLRSAEKMEEEPPLTESELHQILEEQPFMILMASDSRWALWKMGGKGRPMICRWMFVFRGRCCQCVRCCGWSSRWFRKMVHEDSEVFLPETNVQYMTWKMVVGRLSFPFGMFGFMATVWHPIKWSKWSMEPWKTPKKHRLGRPPKDVEAKQIKCYERRDTLVTSTSESKSLFQSESTCKNTLERCHNKVAGSCWHHLLIKPGADHDGNPPNQNAWVIGLVWMSGWKVFPSLNGTTSGNTLEIFRWNFSGCSMEDASPFQRLKFGVLQLFSSKQFLRKNSQVLIWIVSVVRGLDSLVFFRLILLPKARLQAEMGFWRCGGFTQAPWSRFSWANSAIWEVMQWCNNLPRNFSCLLFPSRNEKSCKNGMFQPDVATTSS